MGWLLVLTSLSPPRCIYGFWFPSLFYLCPTPAASSQSSETPSEGGEGGASAWPWREGPLPVRLLPSVQLPTAPLSGLLGITGDAV